MRLACPSLLYGELYGWKMAENAANALPSQGPLYANSVAVTRIFGPPTEWPGPQIWGGRGMWGKGGGEETGEQALCFWSGRIFPRSLIL